MQPSINQFHVQLSAEVMNLLVNAGNTRGLTPAQAFGQAIDSFDPSGIIDTSAGPAPLQPKTFTLSDAQVAQSMGNAVKAGVTEEQAAIAAIRQLAAATL